MKTKYGHLTYCSNIHPGETWKDHFLELKKNLPKIRKKISPDTEMGIGLRLSNEASIELINPSVLDEFQNWLNTEGFYVFLINGFPYGNFHGTSVKENVYHPDWATTDRLEYTIRLFSILSLLLPEGMEGGVSTPPLSYQFFDTNELDRKKRISITNENICNLLTRLIQIQMETGKTLHLDIEPEPDGILGNVKHLLDWYLHLFLPYTIPKIQEKYELTKEESEHKIKNHIRVCLDICHSAVSFEDNQMVVKQLLENSIQVGRIQISSALKVNLNNQIHEKLNLLSQFNEPTYLHQVVAKTESNQIKSYPDLPEALKTIVEPNDEWRIHFHVPVFLENYGLLSSTRNEVTELLNLQKQLHFTNALEVETYTWGVLPKELQMPMADSIIRELEWVLSVLETENK